MAISIPFQEQFPKRSQMSFNGAPAKRHKGMPPGRMMPPGGRGPGGRGPGGRGPGGRGPPAGMRPPEMAREGDWVCSKCGEHNFKFRTICRMCDNTKPNITRDHINDWKCPNCNEHNFSRREQCRKCHLTKQQASTANEDNGMIPPEQRPANWKSGDWSCPNCGDHNFASRIACRNCGKNRKGEDVDPDSLPKGPDGRPLPANWRRGDWFCESCGDHQFANRNQCRQCGAARPGGDMANMGPMGSCYPEDQPWFRGGPNGGSRDFGGPRNFGPGGPRNFGPGGGRFGPGGGDRFGPGGGGPNFGPGGPGNFGPGGGFGPGGPRDFGPGGPRDFGLGGPRGFPPGPSGPPAGPSDHWKCASCGKSNQPQWGMCGNCLTTKPSRPILSDPHGVGPSGRGPGGMGPGGMDPGGMGPGGMGPGGMGPGGMGPAGMGPGGMGPAGMGPGGMGPGGMGPGGMGPGGMGPNNMNRGPSGGGFGINQGVPPGMGSRTNYYSKDVSARGGGYGQGGNSQNSGPKSFYGNST